MNYNKNMLKERSIISKTKTNKTRKRKKRELNKT